MHNIITTNNLRKLGILGKVHRTAIENESPIVKISKQYGDFDFSRLGALPCDEKAEKLKFTVTLPRRAGACGASLYIKQDGGEYISIPLGLCACDYVTDSFVCELSPQELPGSLGIGLYYYYFELNFGSISLYTKSTNNADFELCGENAPHAFKLLVYDKDFTTPEWFCGNIMYQIFVDRFSKGTKEVPVSKTAVINPDWEGGIPQYGEYPGAFVENNMFFGGTLWGVCEKLDYLSALGVGCIYLNPIFKAYSNHKYDTGDYMTVDEMFGGEDALKKLIFEAKKRNIKVIIDGVFNHTGDDSLYFNRYARYSEIGAYQSEQSKYRDWYCFEPDGGYKSWWGIEILPKLNLANPECESYFLGESGVLEKYFDMGIGGVRLDVADELPSAFLEKLRSVSRSKDENALIIGEVWENAVDKVSYGERRGYFRGKQLDSVMNYPGKNALIEFVKNGNAEVFYNTMVELYASYPKVCSDVLMNILGTHDTERILTVLGGVSPDGLSNKELSTKRMTKRQKQYAISCLKVASILQYTIFGTPSVYYGDEAGIEGYHDPFCRMPFPWGREEQTLLSHYRKLGEIRRNEKVFAKGDFAFVHASYGFVAYRRFDENGEITVVANTSRGVKVYELSHEHTDLFTGEAIDGKVKLLPMSAMILKKRVKGNEE